MKKALLITILGLFCFLQAFPQDKKPFITLDNLQLNTRADFTVDYKFGHDTIAPSSDHGFAGKYLVVRDTRCRMRGYAIGACGILGDSNPGRAQPPSSN